MATTIKVKRPTSSYLTHGLWMLLTLFKTIESQSALRYVWGILCVISLMVVTRLLTKKYYMEFRDSTLFIHTDFFRTRIIDSKEIQRVQVETSPFKDSKIILKNQKKIKFNYYNVNDIDFKELLKKLNIPVV